MTSGGRGPIAIGTRLAVAAAVTLAFLRAAPSDGSLALQSWLARTILTHGIPPGAASLGWLGALGGTAVARLGAPAVAAASAALALLALGLVERRARFAGAGPAAPLAGVLAAACMLDALRPGADVAAWCLAALALRLLDAPSRGSGVAFALGTVVWCNVEPAGLLAPAFAVAVAIGATLDAPGALRARDAASAAGLRARWYVAALACGATLCTPAGFGFPGMAFDALRLGGATRGILVTAPSLTAPHAYHAGLFALLALAFAAGVRGSGLRGALPVVVAFVLALANGAFVPIFGVVAAPAVAAALRTVRFPAFIVPAAALALIAAIAFVAGGEPRPTGQPDELAARAVPPPATLFCANVDWCDPATARGGRVVMDGRIAAYGPAARARQRAMESGGAGFTQALAASGTTGVLAGNDTALATLFAVLPGWRTAARDKRATLFERGAP